MRSPLKSVQLLSILLLLILVAIASFATLPGESMLSREFQNSSHTLFFGTIAICMLIILRQSRIKSEPHRLTEYFWAGLSAMILGGLMELTQIFTYRDADFYDLLLDMAGITSFLAFFLTVDKEMKPIISRWSSGLKNLVRISSLIVLLGAFTPPLLWAIATQKRDGIFPLICSFESWAERKIIFTKEASLKIVEGPDGWMNFHGEHVGQLLFSVADYPGIEIIEPVADWSDYRWFSCKFYSALDSAVSITVRIDDKQHNGKFTDRFNRRYSIHPGENNIRIPLTEIESGPIGRKLQLTQISSIMLFLGKPSTEIELFIDDIRLE